MKQFSRERTQRAQRKTTLILKTALQFNRRKRRERRWALGLVWSGPSAHTWLVSNWNNCCVPQILLPSLSSLPSVETNRCFQVECFHDSTRSVRGRSSLPPVF